MNIDKIQVINADVDFALDITADDMLHGVPRDMEKCSGAIACLLRYPGAERVKVCKARTFILHKLSTGTYVWTRYNTPKALREIEVINDVIQKNPEAVKAYARTVILRAPKGKSRASGKQQGSDTNQTNPNSHKPYHTPMRDNAPTRDT